MANLCKKRTSYTMRNIFEHIQRHKLFGNNYFQQSKFYFSSDIG